MKVDSKFKFQVSISKDAYPDNDIAKAMTSSNVTSGVKEIRKQYGYNANSGTLFFRTELTPKELLSKLIIGHTFCNCFKLKDGFTPSNKTIKNFESSNLFCIDIDETKYKSIKGFINKLSMKPTFWYTSYHHKIWKGDKPPCIRFHLVYVIEETITNVITYRYLARKLNEMIDIDTGEKIDDRSNDQAVRYFKGTCFSNPDLCKPEKGITNNIYSFKDLHLDNLDLDDFVNFIKNNADYPTSYLNINKTYSLDSIEQYKRINYKLYIKEKNKIESKNRLKEDLVKVRSVLSSIYNIPLLSPNDKKNTLPNGLHLDDETEQISYICSPTLVYDMSKLSYDDFMRFNRHNYKYFWRPEKQEWIDNLYQYIDDDYFALPFIHEKIKDGNKRRNKLSYRLWLRKIMKPDVDANTLLFNAYEDVHKFFDNSDGVLNVFCLLDKVEECLNKSIEEIKTELSETIERYKSYKPKSGIIFKPGIDSHLALKNKIFKENRYNLINDYYDETLSVKENLAVISEKLFPISERTLYRFIKERNKKQKGKLTDNELYNLIDIKISLRKNMQLLRDSDIKISQTKLKELLRLKKENISLHETQLQNQEKTSYNFDTSQIDDLSINLPTFNLKEGKDELSLPDIQVDFSNTNKEKLNENSNTLFKKLDIDL